MGAGAPRPPPSPFGIPYLLVAPLFLHGARRGRGTQASATVGGSASATLGLALGGFLLIAMVGGVF
jgi:hypothetical protein